MILGKIADFTNDIFTRKQKLTLEIEGDCTELIESLKDDQIRIDIKKYHPKRSMSANGYYWTLVHKIAEKSNVSDAFLHNQYLRDCHCLYMIDGTTVAVTVPDTDEAEREVMEKTDVHLIPSSKTDGKLRYYLLLRGSSDFDSKEMAKLIDLAIQDANSLGIETITETEKERLIALYGKRI